MSNLEEINQQKIQLEREQEKLEDLKRDINQTEEHYEEYFFYQKQLFNELQEEFAQSRQICCIKIWLNKSTGKAEAFKNF